MRWSFFHLNCNSEENSSWFYSGPKIPAAELKDGLQTTSFAKPEFSFLMLAVGNKPGVASVLAIYQKPVTFNPKPTCMLNYFFRKQIWSGYLQGWGNQQSLASQLRSNSWHSRKGASIGLWGDFCQVWFLIRAVT